MNKIPLIYFDMTEGKMWNKQQTETHEDLNNFQNSMKYQKRKYKKKSNIYQQSLLTTEYFLLP